MWTRIFVTTSMVFALAGCPLAEGPGADDPTYTVQAPLANVSFSVPFGFGFALSARSECVDAASELACRATTGPAVLVNGLARGTMVTLLVEGTGVWPLMVARLGPCRDAFVGSSPRGDRHAAAGLLGLAAIPFAGLDQRKWSPL
jgi:hypothetical protein